MRVAITGASGLVGSRLAQHLRGRGNDVVPLARGGALSPGCASWNPATGALGLDEADAIVHLAGANVANGRWTRARKRAIAESRIGPTARLCATLAAMTPRPRVLVSASAVGYYGDRGDEELDERSGPGDDFLARTARDWEAATESAAEAGIRVVKLRIGVVLDRRGGALPRLLRPFRLGLGGRLGHGRQWMSWITLDDLVAAIERAIGDESLRGPVLGVAPEPVTNREFTRALAASLHRPALFPVPAWALRLALGEMADGLLLSSQRARPRALTATDFSFAHPTIDEALRVLCS